MMTTRLETPNSIKKAVAYPQYLETSVTAPLPSGKAFAVTRRLKNIPISNAIPSKVTHINQYTVGPDSVTNDQKWWTLRTAFLGNLDRGYVTAPYNGTINAGQTIHLDGTGNYINSTDVYSEDIYNKYGSPNNNLSITHTVNAGEVTFHVNNPTGSNITINGTFKARFFASVSEIAQYIYNSLGVRKLTGLFSEMVENGMNFELNEQVFRGLYNYMKANDSSINSPTDTNIIADYFQFLYGYGSWINVDHADALNSMTSASLAKGDNYYYSRNAFEYRNRMIGGYFDDIGRLNMGLYLYNTIYHMEKEYIAMNDRKCATFGWGGFEGIEGGIANEGVFDRLPLTNPDGDLIRLSRMSGSYQLMELQAFISVIIGDQYYLWNDSAIVGTDVNCWVPSWWAGGLPEFTKWQPEGGSIVQWDINNPNHPKRAVGCSAEWSSHLDAYHNGAFAGIWKYSQIVNRLTTLKYANFSFVEDGTTKSGYFDGNAPVSGSLGNASVSRFGISNYGQNNIVRQYHSKKPIVLYGTGSGGSVYIIYNPWAALLTPTPYTINEGGTEVINHFGPGLGVYLKN